MASLICPDCGTPFETVTPADPDAPGVAQLACGRRSCPSGSSGGKPNRTTARGRAIDDKRAASGASRQTGGYVVQRSTGSSLIDGLLGFGKQGKRKRR
jgi:hypothetical protein